MLEFSFSVTSLAKTLGKTHQAIHKFCNEHDISITPGKNRSFLSPQSLRQYLKKFGYTYPKEVIAFQACKGGVGKTSLCFNIAARAAQYGAKVLLIDMDMQAHLTLAVLGINNTNMLVWHDILKGTDIQQTIKEVHPHFHLVPSHLDNSYLDKDIFQSSKVVYAIYVQNHIEKIKNKYDLILIDCSPALSHINTAVAIASNKIFIPVNPDLFSFDGLEKTLAELIDIQSGFNKELDVTVILNRFDSREKNSMDVIAELKNKYGDFLCPTVVVVSTEMKNSIVRGEFLFSTKKHPQIAYDIDTITKSILKLPETNNA